MYVCFNPGDVNDGFVYFGASTGFGVGGEKRKTWCGEVSQTFESLHDTTLTGMCGKCSNGPYHHCTRIVAVQLS